MKHVDGIRVGEFVRNRMEDFHTRILYMSSSKEYLLELFDSQPVGFLEKPLTREKVNSGMDRILRQMEENSFCYRSGRISRQVPYREILYYESCGRKVLVHTNDGIYEYFPRSWTRGFRLIFCVSTNLISLTWIMWGRSIGIVCIFRRKIDGCLSARSIGDRSR